MKQLIRKKIWVALFLVSFIHAFGQREHDALEESRLNIPYLEHLVKQEIDQVRKSFKVKPLINDKILFQAAASHADYLVKYNRFSHYEEGQVEMRTPQKRAEFHGAKNYLVGENIVKVPINSLVDTKTQGVVPINTYGQAASVMRMLWVNSPGHFANIKTSDYDITGVSISYSKERKELVCVQKFGMVSEFYVHQENKKLFPYTAQVADSLLKSFVPSLPKRHKKHAYGIKDSKKEKYCKDCNFNVFKGDNVKVGVRGDSLYLYIKKRNLKPFMKFFTEKKDGVAIEFVDFDHTYSCEVTNNTAVPTRRNGRCEFDGVISQPIYTKEILQKVTECQKWHIAHKTRLEKNDFLKISIGKLPEIAREERVAANFLAFKSNRLCYVSQGREVCGSKMESPLITLPFKDQLKEGKFSPKVKPTLMKFRLNFDRNQADYKSEKMMEIVQELKATNNLITHVSIDAFASVEGTKEINEKLFQKRAKGIVAFFESYQNDTIKFKLKTKENWSMFYQQLEGSDYAFLLKKDTAAIRAYVNKTKKDEGLNFLLGKQRYAFIKLQIKPIIRGKDSVKMAQEAFKKRMLRGSDSRAKMKKLLELQQFVYSNVTKGDYSIDSVKLDIPFKEAYLQLLFNELMFEYKQGQVGHHVYYKRLLKLNSFGQKHNFLFYNTMAYVFNYQVYQEDLTDKLSTMVALMKKLKVGKDTVANYQLHLTHLRINDFVKHHMGSLSAFKKNLNVIHQHYDSLMPTFTDEFKFKLAKYYVFTSSYRKAHEILKPLANKSNYDHRVYVWYLKSYYFLQVLDDTIDDVELRLMDADQKLTNQEWCDLYMGPCNINFEIFDYAPLKNMYCEKCKNKRP